MTSSSTPSEPDPPPKSDYDPTPGTSTQLRNFWAALTGQMSPRGLASMKNARDEQYEASDIAKCEAARDYLFTYSPIIRFMREQVASLGGTLDAQNVVCARCPISPDGESRQGGGFSPQYGIQICANEFRGRGWLEDTLAHEMMHAWDHLRFEVDWLGEGKAGLRQAACAEIRASNLSGECRFLREFMGRNQWKFTKQQQECVRRRAILSVRARPACKNEAQAMQAVDEVWESCFNDTRPFDEIYR